MEKGYEWMIILSGMSNSRVGASFAAYPLLVLPPICSRREV